MDESKKQAYMEFAKRLKDAVANKESDVQLTTPDGEPFRVLRDLDGPIGLPLVSRR